MTQDELDALPIIGEITYELQERDGKQVRVPKAPVVGALHQEPDDPSVIWDRWGQSWMVGRAFGKRWKRRMSGI